MIQSVHDESKGWYGARKVWRKLSRTDGGPAQCIVERLIRKQGLQGVSRGYQLDTLNSAFRLLVAGYFAIKSSPNPTACGSAGETPDSRD